MKIILIGSGGREHALAWKLSQSSSAERIYCCPGNGGTAIEQKCENVQLKNFNELISFCKEKSVDLTVVGPEQPLSEGVVNEFEKEGLKIFGPTKEATQIESSKSFAKRLMSNKRIPTAAFDVFRDSDEAIDFINEYPYKSLVIKADGLAAGKGVIVCSSKKEAIKAVKDIMEKKIFGEAGEKIVIEEELTGEEASVLAFTDGKDIKLMLSSQDHKKIFDNDKGPNTGGMGAHAPAPIVAEKMKEKLIRQIFRPAIEGLKEEGIKYKGVLYAGIMIREGESMLLEFNVRFGDPETQAILPLLETDLAEIMNAVVEERLNEVELNWSNNSACCVVLSSKGYPESYEKGKKILGLDSVHTVSGVNVFHAGTKIEEKEFLTNGGRVLGVTGIGSDLKEAREKAYQAIKLIDFDGMHYRTDIGVKGLR
ncbi:MAG: phosphoribosylamine--glycine ligase [Candidatus Diapherotrites archaeon]